MLPINNQKRKKKSHLSTESENMLYMGSTCPQCKQWSWSAELAEATGETLYMLAEHGTHSPPMGLGGSGGS